MRTSMLVGAMAGLLLVAGCRDPMGPPAAGRADSVMEDNQPACWWVDGRTLRCRVTLTTK